jgi:uncharacterized protein Veg
MTQLDLNRVRQSIKNQIGSKIKISANRGRHKFVTAKGVITQTYLFGRVRECRWQ